MRKTVEELRATIHELDARMRTQLKRLDVTGGKREREEIKDSIASLRSVIESYTVDLEAALERRQTLLEAQQLILEAAKAEAERCAQYAERNALWGAF